MTSEEIKKLCYDLSLIHAKHSIESLPIDDPYVNTDNSKIEYLFNSFEECYLTLTNKPADYFKHLLK